MKKSTRLRTFLLWLAGFRILLGIAAIPLAKFLYSDHFLLLVVMRPTKEVLLAGAYKARATQSSALLLQIVLAAIPLSILGVWHFYYLGRLYATEIKSEKLPGIVGRILPLKKIAKLQKVLKKKGSRVVFWGRLAAFPSALVGAAAGSSKVKAKQFLPPDAIGALVGIAEVMSVGYLLGGFFNKDDPKTTWLITGVGVVVLFGLLFLIGRYLNRES